MRIAVFALSLAAAVVASGLAHAGCGFAINPPPALAKAMEDCNKAEQAAGMSSTTTTTAGKTVITTITTTTTTDDKPAIIYTKPDPKPAITCVRRYGYYTGSVNGYPALLQGMRTVCGGPQAFSAAPAYPDLDGYFFD